MKILAQVYTAEELLSIVPVPLQGEPFKTAFSSMMAEFSVWGQTAMMVQKLQQQSNHCRVQSMVLTEKSNRLNTAIAKLKAERDNLVKLRHKLHALDKEVGVKEETEQALLTEIAMLKQNKTLVATVAAIERARSTSSPSNYPPAMPETAPAVPKDPDASQGHPGMTPGEVVLTSESSESSSDDDDDKDEMDMRDEDAVANVLGL
jgi:hypothetical protein